MAQNASSNTEQGELGIIGSTEYVSVEGIEKVPAKIDTGADSSSIWASDIKVEKDGTLSFKLFAPDSPHYTGETIQCKDYKVSVVRSSNGNEQIRYRTKLSLIINGRKIASKMTLSDRSRNNFPILIGRKTISGKFLVDVSKFNTKRPEKNRRTHKLNTELNKNPYKFHQKYIENKSKQEK
jgi:hypothetical protein